MSWVNVIMYSAVLPSYNSDNEKKGKQQEVIKADDPKNNKRVKDIIDNLD